MSINSKYIQMNLDLNTTIESIMTTSFVHVSVNTLMTDVAIIFDKNDFSHIPVLNDEGQVMGIISKSDYRRLQHPFTKLFEQEAKINNSRLFACLTAEDVMTPGPTCIHYKVSLASAIGVFMENRFHALPVLKDRKCIGIITPYDILKFINVNNLKAQEI
jgi:acetoin utilization protein AcuB